MLLSDPSQPISNGSGDTAARELGSSRAAADTRPNGADRSDPMSTGDSPAQIARRVENRVRNVTTRPCGCESLDCQHPYRAVLAGAARADYVGPVCDACATSHLLPYLITETGGTDA